MRSVTSLIPIALRVHFSVIRSVPYSSKNSTHNKTDFLKSQHTAIPYQLCQEINKIA